MSVKPVFGGAGLRPGRFFGNTENLPALYSTLEAGGCSTIDTATLYGDSERILGETQAPSRFTIDTKTKGGFAGKGYATKEKVIEEAETSAKLLGSGVDVFYIHAPDDGTPIEETLAGVNEVYKKGFFKRFGLSNYKAADVEKVYNHCKEHNYPLPSVYQGNYNPVARKQESLLFPTLHRLDIAFYAYSPIAGGFLTKTPESILAGAGRFHKSDPAYDLYTKLYNRPVYLSALEEWQKIAKEEGIEAGELAYRWVIFHSALEGGRGDALIFGASSLEQVGKTLGYFAKGKLSDKAVEGVERVWKTVEHEAPLDNYHM